MIKLFSGLKKDSMSPKVQPEDVLEILIKKNWIIKPQADYIRAESQAMKKPIDQILTESDIVNQDKLVQGYSELFNLPIVKLNEIYIPYDLITKIPQKIAENYHIVVFDQSGEDLKIAISRPYQLQSEKPGLLAKVSKKQKVQVSLYLTSEDDFRNALKYYHPENFQQNQIKKMQNQEAPTTETTSSKQTPAKLVRKEEEKEGIIEKKIVEPKTQTPEQIKLPTILDILVSQKLLNQKEALEIFQKSKQTNLSPEQIIRSGEYVSSDDLTKAQAQAYNLPYISFKEIDLDPEKVQLFPQNIAQEYKLIVFDTISDRIFKVATSNPENPAISEIIKFLKEKNDIDIQLYTATPEDINLGLDKYKMNLELTETIQEPITVPKEGEEVGELDIGSLLKKDIQTQEELEQIVKSEDVPKITAAIINYALVKKASDIHIEPWKEDKMHVRYRVDGVLRDIVQIDKKLHPAVIARIKISSRLRIDEQRIPQDGRFDVKFKKHDVDIRVSTLPTSNGEKCVMRLLDKSKGVISLEALGMRGKSFDVIVKNIKKPFGMILATGPTGSGKTTTLYAALQFINSSETNIVTLEDPIEYEIDGVNHCQARADIGFSFAEGLRSILRQDPNIIMVGEIRDKETAAMAIHAALTGHLVFSSLHTNDAVGAVPRMIDMGIEPFLISSSLSAVIAQRLVRKICDKCKEKVSLPAEVMEKIKKELQSIPANANVKIQEPYQFWRGKGCNNCENGYSGRIGIYEVLPMSTEIQKLTISRASSEEIKKEATKEGMITMKQDGLLKALEEITTIDEVLRVTLVEGNN